MDRHRRWLVALVPLLIGSLATLSGANEQDAYHVYTNGKPLVRFEFPTGWTYSQQSEAGGYPLIVFKSPGGKPLYLNLIVMWRGLTGQVPMTPDKLKNFIGSRRELVNSEAAKDIELRALQVESGSGYWFAAPSVQRGTPSSAINVVGGVIQRDVLLVFAVVVPEQDQQLIDTIVECFAQVQPEPPSASPKKPGIVLQLYEWIDAIGQIKRGVTHPFAARDEWMERELAKNRRAILPIAYRFPIPNTSLDIEFPGDGFVLSIADGGIPYYFLVNEKTGLNVSFLFERNVAGMSAQEIQEIVEKSLEEHKTQDNPTVTRVGKVYLIESSLVLDQEKNLLQHSALATLALDGAAVKLHLSAVSDRPFPRSLFVGFVKSLKFEKRNESSESLNQRDRVRKANALNEEAGKWRSRGDYEKAIAAYTEALQIDPESALVLCNRAGLYSIRQEYALALADYRTATQVDPTFAPSFNGVAWIAAACPKPELRDGRLAVEMATKACELTDWKQAIYIDTLASAYAESGDFASAMKWSDRALQIARTSERAEILEHRHEFPAKRPVRMTAEP